MGDASVRLTASALAIAVGIWATTRLAAESSRPPLAIAASEVAAALGERALVEAAPAGHQATLTMLPDADAAMALCRGTASAALLGRALTVDEIDACRAADLRPDEIPVAFAVAAVGVPIGNAFVDALSIEQLRRIFARAKGERLTFRELDPRWPDLEVVAVGVESPRGARAILERQIGSRALSFEGHASAADVGAAIEADPGAVGFLGSTQPGALAHALRLIPIRDRRGEAVFPTRDALESESYPLGTTLWLVSDAASPREDVRRFSRSLPDAIFGGAGSADCLSFRQRARRERVAGR
jgi:hypothetical protein